MSNCNIDMFQKTSLVPYMKHSRDTTLQKEGIHKLPCSHSHQNSPMQIFPSQKGCIIFVRNQINHLGEIPILIVADCNIDSVNCKMSWNAFQIARAMFHEQVDGEKNERTNEHQYTRHNRNKCFLVFFEIQNS